MTGVVPSCGRRFHGSIRLTRSLQAPFEEERTLTVTAGTPTPIATPQVYFVFSSSPGCLRRKGKVRPAARLAEPAEQTGSDHDPLAVTGFGGSAARSRSANRGFALGVCWPADELVADLVHARRDELKRYRHELRRAADDHAHHQRPGDPVGSSEQQQARWHERRPDPQTNQSGSQPMAVGLRCVEIELRAEALQIDRDRLWLALWPHVQRWTSPTQTPVECRQPVATTKPIL